MCEPSTTGSWGVFGGRGFTPGAASRVAPSNRSTCIHRYKPHVVSIDLWSDGILFCRGIDGDEKETKAILGS